MASRETSAMNEGQMWNVWADCIGLKISDSDEDDADAEKKKIESDAMKLRKDDMSLFGLCPAWDDFFLAVCEMCGYVVKPQSLRNHIELRHGNTHLVRSERSEAAMQHPKSSTGKGASSITMPNKSVSSQGAKSSSSSSPRHPNKTNSHSHGSHSSSSHNSSNSSSSGNKQERPKPVPKSKKGSLAPIVRMERIPQSLMKTASTSQSNSAPGDKKELPSPQQPPPVAPVSGSTVSSSTSGPGPGHGPSLSSGNPVSPSIGHVTSHLGGKSEGPYQGLKKQQTSSKNKKAPKERKLLLCKDREYDPNKHCGVVIAETGKQCTRSLTCKTHSLSLRRAVVGRKKNFDDLLSDHRAAKEASVKATSVKGSPVRPNSGDRVESQPQLSDRDTVSGASTTVSSAKSASGLKVNTSSSNSQFRSPAAPISSQSASKAASTQGIPPNRIPPVTHMQDSSEVQDDEKRHQDSEQTSIRSNLPDPPYINRHPKPVAVCTFGMRQLGNGLLMTDRRWDFVRAALKVALTTERSNHPPPLKKLCVESRLPPVPEPVDPSDPYSFTCSEPSSVASSVPHSTTTAITTTTTASKSAIATTTEVVHSHNPLSTTSGKTKTSTVSTTSSVISHKPAQPKIITAKTKEKSNSVNKTSSNSPSNPNKKKRTSAHVPNGTSVVSKPPVLPSLSAAATLSPVVVTQTQAVPLSFPVAISDHLGALSRLQVAGRNSITLSPAIIRNTGISTSSGTSTTTTTKDGNVVVTGLDVLNGQIPVSSALLHSVTVSRPLIATSGSGFGITLGAAGLMGQLSQLPKSTGLDGDVSSSSHNPGNEKNSHLLSSMLNNSHVLTKAVGNPSVSSWSRTKAKPKVRKNVKTTVVNSVCHASNVSESHATSILQGSIHTNLSSALNTVSSSHQLPVSSVASPHLRSESTSPQVPASSPLHNGLGPSPPPFFSPKGISISGTMGSNQPLSSPASRGSTPSPGIDMSPPGSGQKVWRHTVGGKLQHRHHRINPEMAPYVQRSNGEKKFQ